MNFYWRINSNKVLSLQINGLNFNLVSNISINHVLKQISNICFLINQLIYFEKIKVIQKI